MVSHQPDIILAIETSQREASVAVRDARNPDHPVVHEEKLAAASRHDDDLLPAIDRLFLRVGLKPEDLKNGAVAVSIGPGGFTGLRIAISTAKMLGEALGAKLVAVPSALVAAESAANQEAAVVSASAGRGSWETRIIVALAAKGDTAWVTRFRRSRGQEEWMLDEEPGLVDAMSIDAGAASAVLADEHFPAAARARLESLRVPVVDPRFSAAACLQVGMRKLARGEVTDAMSLLPLYPRVPEAVTLWRARSEKTREH